MRNLKRILAMAMAVVMILGMMVIGSSAASYTDEAQIDDNYAVAVEVLTGMGVFKGTGNGFAPKQILTRAEAAALIYRIISADVTDSKIDLYDYSSFDDVKAGAWYTGYITYAANGGHIVGDGTGNFNPNAQVTGVQVLKIMLSAMGYGAQGEFEGAGWSDNVLTTADDLDLLDNVSINSLNGPASREVVAQLLFDAIQAPTTTYTPAFGYVDVLTDQDSLGWKKFGLASADSQDDWGRPATVWFSDADEDDKKDTKETLYATIPDAPIAAYTEAVSECDIAEDLDLDGKTNLVTVYTNGKDGTDNINALSQATLGGQGTLLEVYDEDHIVVIDTYLAQITKITDEKTDKNGHVTREASVKLNVWYDDEDADVMTVEGTTEYDVNDFVLVYVNEEHDYVEIVEAADSMVGAQTAYTTKASHIVEGTEYPDAAKFLHDEAVNKTTDYTWYFDSYGNLIGSFYIPTTYSYGTISSIYWKDSSDGEDGYAQAVITFIDGSSESAIIDSIDGTTLKSGDSTSSYYYGRVSETKSYNEDEFANVALYEIESGRNGLVLTETTELPGATTETGVPALTDNVDAGNATMFLVWDADDEEYETYTGIKNVPTYVAGEFWYVDVNDNDVAEYVFIIDPTAEDDEQTITYYWNRKLDVTTNLKNSKIVSYTIDGGYVDGEALEITTKDVAIKNAILTWKSTLLILTETNGVITDLEVVTTNPVKVDSLGAYVVYAGEAYDAVLDQKQDILVDEYGNSYDVEDIEQIADDEDLVDAIDKDDTKDAAEYLYIVYKKGSSNTKIASLIYVSTVQGAKYVAPSVVPNNLRKVEINGVTVTEISGGAGTQDDPYQVVAESCFDGVTNYSLDVTALTTAQEIEIGHTTTLDKGTGMGFASDTSTGVAGAGNKWYFTIDGTWYVATVNVLSHPTELTVTGMAVVNSSAKKIMLDYDLVNKTANDSEILDGLAEVVDGWDPANMTYDHATKTLTVSAECEHTIVYTVVIGDIAVVAS